MPVVRKRPARCESSKPGGTSCLPVILVTGYLGAGKTTFVKHMLKSRGNLKAAVFVSEFGAADVDGEILRRQGDIERRRVFTLKDGCLCCGGKDDLVNVVHEELHEMELDMLIVETSGASDPWPILTTLASIPRVYVDKVICVVDTTTARSATFGAGQDASRQIAAADVLVLSKVDMLQGGTKAAEQLELQLLKIHEEFLKPTTPACDKVHTIWASHGTITSDSLQLVLPQVINRGMPAKRRRRDNDAAESDVSVDQGKHENFASHMWFRGGNLDKKKFLKWSAALARNGSVLRAKGLLSIQGHKQPMLWHLAGGRSNDLEELGSTIAGMGPSNELVIIGHYGAGWEPMKFDSSLEDCLSSSRAK